MLSAPRLRRSWRALSSSVFVLLPLVWYTHVVLTKLGDPLGVYFDGFLWGTATVLKIVAWVALFQALQSVHVTLFDSGPRALRACLIWATAALLVLAVLALLRSWWAPLLSSDALKYYYAGDGLKLGGELRANRETWLRSWSNGTVIASECALFSVLAALQAGIAYRIGRLSFPSALTACLACALVLCAYVIWCPWFRWDYDFFQGDVVAVALSFDLFLPIAQDPSLTLVLPLYVALRVADGAILRSNGRAS